MSNVKFGQSHVQNHEADNHEEDKLMLIQVM
jgi:hypothetical protein